jgi:hypothetical protein
MTASFIGALVFKALVEEIAGWEQKHQKTVWGLYFPSIISSTIVVSVTGLSGQNFQEIPPSLFSSLSAVGRIWWINHHSRNLLGERIQKAYRRAISLL